MPQLTQVAPLVPHWLDDVASTHVLPVQHPPPQVDELQVPGHAPSLHPPLVHAEQVAPPVPQLAVVGGSTHVVPLQQPAGQEAGVHVQLPPMHCCPLGHAAPVLPQTHVPAAVQVSEAIPQFMHVPPFAPHCPDDVVWTHAAPLQQPPLHESAVHTHSPAMHA